MRHTLILIHYYQHPCCFSCLVFFLYAIFPPCFLDLSPCYTINVYDSLVSKKRVDIVLGLGYPEVGFSTRHVFGHHWPFFSPRYQLFWYRLSCVTDVCLERCLASLTLPEGTVQVTCSSTICTTFAFASVLPFCQFAFQWLNVLTTCMLARFQYICSNNCYCT